MSRSRYRYASFLLLGAVALLLPACGGGSSGASGGSGSGLLIQSTSIPPAESGGLVNYVIDIEGGCGGPYDVQLLSGALPLGVAIIDKDTWDDDRYEGEGFTQFEHRLFGSPLEDGTYTFDLQLVDTGCTPFASATASYLMRVSVGEVGVVTVEQDGNPALIPTGQTPYNPDHPALPKVVYNDFTSLQFIIAGGVGPYSLKIWDDPNIPNDGNLPLGVSIAATSIVGSPVEVGPDGGPFLCSFEITDSVGETTYFTAYWKIDTPVIIVATESIADGQAGMPYSDTFIVAGGVPPFDFEFVEVGMPEDYTSDANPNPSNPDADVLYNPGEAPTVNPPEALNKVDDSSYPAQTDQGPDYAQSNQGIPSEGIYVIETSGSFSGIPRRRGTYSVNMHVKSGLVPNSFGQHAWATYGFEILAAGPVAQDPSYTLEPAFTQVPPYAQIQGADQGESYNPDGGVDGLQLLANGGVPQDGRTDAPHYSQTDDANDETYGAYTWEVDWDPDDEGNDVVPAMELTPDGRFKIQDGQEDDLVPMMDRALGFNAIDYALPVQLATTKAEKVRFGIGPDRAIVLESTTSFQPASSSYDNRPHNDTAMAMKVLTSRASGADSMDAISSDHLVGEGDGKIDLPEDAGDITPAALFSGMDIVRVAVNPTGWWDDTFHLNPKAARPFQHGDRNSPYAYYGLGGNGSTYTGSASSYYTGKYMYQPTATCVRLPSAPSVKADRKNGVYNDGGKFYVFETKTHIGVFVIRPDTGIYVPAAYDKDDTGWVSFGDNWVAAHASNVPSGVKIPQMTVSPDGRVGAMKLRSDTKLDQYETADTTAILLISLTGEGMFDGEVSMVIETGSDGSTSQGLYQFASSLTLTNDYLYYIIGSGSKTYLSWKDHYIYRYELDSGDDAGEMLHSKFSSEWTNTSGSAMQMPFQNFYNSFLWSNGNPDPRMYCESGYNCHEVGTAPHPFRVNADGNACAILAGTTTGSTSGSTVLKHHVWIDYEGELTQLSDTKRRTSGGGRGTQLFGGPMYYPVSYQWGAFTGPTTRFEISDDGQKVAVSYSRNTSEYSGAPSYSTGKYHYREDIAAFVTTDGWSSHKIHEITGDSSTSTSPNGKFRTSTVWRFGALTFTADGGGLVFWGGRSNYGPTRTYSSSSTVYYMYYGAKSYVGSIYSYDFSDGSVRNILGSKEGGAKDTVGSALTSINYSTSSWQTDGGAVKPFGGFISKNRNFLYISNRGALTSSDQRDGMVIGVNIRSLNTSNSINGQTDGRAFVVDGFASINGFVDGSYAYHYMGLGYYYNYAGYNWYYSGNYGGTLKGAATDNGWVFFTSTDASTYAYAARSSTYGGAVNATYFVYPYYPKKLYVFDPNVGGDMQQIASKWGGQDRYAVVGGVEVSDDGSTVGCVFCSSAYYNYSDKEKLSVWTNVELDASGDLDYDKLTENHVESSQGYVGSHFAFGPNNVDIYYAQGTGNENQQELKKATVDGGTPSAFSFPKKNYNVLHAGR